MIDLLLFGCPGAMTATALMKASLALTAVSTAVSYMGARSQAKKQSNYQNHLAKLQQEAGNRKASAAVARNIQQREETARTKERVSREAMATRADATLSAAEGGVTGLSIQHIIADAEAQESQYIASLTAEQNLRNREMQRGLADIALGTSQQVHSTMAPVNQPNAFAYALQGAASGLKIMSDSGQFTDDPSTLSSDILTIKGTPQNPQGIPKLPA